MTDKTLVKWNLLSLHRKAFRLPFCCGNQKLKLITYKLPVSTSRLNYMRNESLFQILRYSENLKRVYGNNCRPSGWLYSPARMRTSRQKKSHNFQRLSLFSILYNDFLKFLENHNKEFKLGPTHFHFPRTGNYITSRTLAF